MSYLFAQIENLARASAVVYCFFFVRDVLLQLAPTPIETKHYP